jgi:hypothetical protein
VSRDGMADVIAALREAIRRGVPLFNKGDHGA